MINIHIQSILRCMQRSVFSTRKYAPVKKYTVAKKLLQSNFIKNTRYKQQRWDSNRKEYCYSVGLSFSILGWFKSEKEEPEVITTIKRSVLLIQRTEYKKAEQMLHIALKQAQDIQNPEAVTYIYDLMANLAFVQEDYKKAEKLFTTVMQRLIAEGAPEDDLRIIHMSLKMAKMYEYQEDFQKAKIGYQYCLDHLQKLVNQGSEDLDVLKFYGMTMDWYARMLVTLNNFSEAYKYFLNAYDVSLKIHGKKHPENVVLLNDLGTISCNLGNLDQAIDYIKQALELGQEIEDTEDLSIVYVNLGNVYMKKKMYEEAKKWCKEGWKFAKSKNDDEALKEANQCLEEVNKKLP